MKCEKETCTSPAVPGRKQCRVDIDADQWGWCLRQCGRAARDGSLTCAVCERTTQVNGAPDDTRARCNIEQCERVAQKYKQGRCLSCWQQQHYGTCSLCHKQPARDSKGTCSKCRKRGSGPTYSPGALINNAEIRWCPRCEKTKKVEDFYSNKSNTNGISRHCRDCLKDRALKKSVRTLAYAWLSKWCEQTSAGLCVRCGKSHGQNWELDHIIPISWGGSDFLDNLQIMCRECNQGKKNTEDIDYRKWIAQPVEQDLRIALTSKSAALLGPGPNE
jgi:hypothetical protein